MKNLFIVFTIFIFSNSIIAQNISLNNINSNNVLELFRPNQVSQILPEGKSINITTQTGDGNTIVMNDNSPNYMEMVQSGNYNTTLFVNPNDYPTNAEIKINGSGNYIDITGSNSISDGMKMNINANDMKIFMRNY